MRFITPVSMAATKEQFEKDLKQPLLKMGYTVEYDDEENTIHIGTNFGTTHNHCENIGRSLTKKFGRHFIDQYNPELFLALAAMTDSDKLQLGEYLIPKHRKATKEELIGKFYNISSLEIKERKLTPRFPIMLKSSDACRIVNSACPVWKRRLAKMWGYSITLFEDIEITEDYYNSMREECTDTQNILFDEIFGKDEIDKNVFKKYILSLNEGLNDLSNAFIKVNWDSSNKIGRPDLKGRALLVHEKCEVVLHKISGGQTIIEIKEK